MPIQSASVLKNQVGITRSTHHSIVRSNSEAVVFIIVVCRENFLKQIDLFFIH